jgi:phosphatidylglycerophosphate synthase
MDAPPAGHGPRRELKSRNTVWAPALARRLAAAGCTPNGISVTSMAFAALALVCYLAAPETDSRAGCALLWLAAAAAIQLRLLCNLMDGLVAVECGKATATGPIYNEAPDRVADVLILVGAGYSSAVEPGVIKLFGVLPLGWSCAVLAVGTAYLRLLQGTLTGKQSFTGPMAKQHRMAVLTAGTLLAAVEVFMRSGEMWSLKAALIVIFFGALITCWRRLRLIVEELQNRGA